MKFIACPNCKVSLGWATPEYEDTDTPWYKPTKHVIRCKYCGARFKAEPKYLSYVTSILVLASVVYLQQGFAGWGKWVIGILLGIVLILGILEFNRPYERID
jgi:hypothetical protein